MKIRREDTMTYLSSDNRSLMICIVYILVMTGWVTGTASAQPSASLIRAYYVKKMPPDYKKQEQFIASLKDTGANTVILELPMNEQEMPELVNVHNAVYLAHQAGMKIHIVLPTRKLAGILSQHSDWEDNQYDLGQGTVTSTGKLDLFNKAVVEYLTSLAKEIASYSVDGLLLGPDFHYSPVEGIGTAASEHAVTDLKWAPDPRLLFKKVRRGSEGPIIEEYGEYYGRWTSFKRDRLLYVFDQIRKAGRSANAGLKIGVPIPLVVPVSTDDRIFNQFAYDMNAFRKLNCDYYWTAIDYRDIKRKQNLTYRQTMEQLSRRAYSAITTVKSPDQVILALQAITETGAMIPMFEMEEISVLVKNAGETGIAYIIGPEATISRTFMKKIFYGTVKP